MRNQLAQDQLRVRDLFAQIHVRYLDEPDYVHIHAGNRSFVNINTPDDLKNFQ